MKWSIVIPTYRRSELLGATLRALRGQSESDFEVVVVSDGFDPNTIQLGREFEAPFSIQWLFRTENQGLASARNAGANAALGELLLFLDDDIIAHPDLLRHHEIQHADHPHTGLVVYGRTIEQRQLPFQSNTDRRMQMTWEGAVARAFPVGGKANTDSIGKSAESSVFFGLNCSISKRDFLNEGLFNERLRSDEECEFGYRLYNRGYIFKYSELAGVCHLNSKDMSKYYPECWARSGLNDLYRVRELNQRCAQTSQLAAFRDSSLQRRLVTRLMWQSPRFLLKVASIAERITNSTNSYASFAIWARSRRLGEYWNAVKESGVSLAEIRQLAGAPARLLSFHSLSQPQTPAEVDLCLPTPRFKQILLLLKTFGYTIAHPDDLLADRLPKKNAILTFDDAYDDLYSELLPIIQRTGIAPLIFVVANEVGGSNVWDQADGLRARSLLTVEQLREMQKYGAVIGAHSLTHPSLPLLSCSEIIREVRDSKSRLEDLFGRPIEWFAYPYGHADRKVRAIVAEAGFKAAVTTEPGLNHWQDRLALRRIEVNSKDTLVDLLGKLITGKNVRLGFKNRIKKRRPMLSRFLKFS